MSADERIGTAERERLASDLALRGGRLALEYFHRAHVTSKPDGSLVTDADLAIQERLAAEIARAFPDDAIIGEEAGLSTGPRHALYRWVLDPVDGTNNFARGLPGFSVSIGVLRNGQPFAGAVYDPITRWLFAACAGRGAWLNDRRLRVSGRRAMIEMLFATGIPFGGRPELPGALREIAALTPQTAGIRRMGSAALDLAYVAAGRLDGYWERRIRPWDCAAGLLLVREAGGFVGSIEDDGDIFADGNIAAANANVYDAFRKILLSV